MGARVDAELRRRLDAAEAAGACLAPFDAAERKALLRRMWAWRLVSPDTGLFVRTDTWLSLDPIERALARMRGLTELHPAWTFCGPSALIAHGFPISWEWTVPLHVARKPGYHCEHRRGINWHCLRGEESEIVAGIRACDVVSACADAMCSLPFREGILVGDHFPRQSGHELGRLAAELEVRRGARGIRRARSALSFANPLSESGGESIGRAIMIEEGYQIPELQVWADDPLRPGHGFRSDFGWFDANGILFARGECDGKEKYTNEEMTGGRCLDEVQMAERRRESRISVYGVPMLRFSPAEARDLPYFRRLLDLYGIPKVPGGHRIVR